MAGPGSFMNSFDEVQRYPSYILGIRQFLDVIQDFQWMDI